MISKGVKGSGPCQGVKYVLILRLTNHSYIKKFDVENMDMHTKVKQLGVNM